MSAEDVLARVRRTGTIGADDALAVRRAVYGGDALISASEIEAMLQIDEAARSADPGWSQLVNEAGADYLVRQEEPAGYLSEENARWLADRISVGGMVKTPRQFEMLVHVVEAASSAPESLSAMALRQVVAAVVEGKGPLASGGAPLGRVGPGEVDRLRRILYAFGGERGAAISHDEAEALFDINDAVAGARNDPAWDDLFVKAIANFMMAATGYLAPSRDAAKKRAEWLDSPDPGLGGFVGRMVSGGLKGIVDAYRSDPDNAAVATQEDAIRAAEIVTVDEAAWLASRIGRDGAMHENEKALLRFIREEAPAVPPALAALMDRAAA